MATRDWYLAHSISELEECQIGITLTNDEPPQVKTIMWTHSVLGLQPDVFRSLANLTNLLQSVVAANLDRAAKAAEQEARALDPKELNSRQQHGVAPGSTDVATTPRSRPTPLPAIGTRGFVAEATVHDEPAQGPAFGPDRDRNIVMWKGEDEDPEWICLPPGGN